MTATILLQIRSRYLGFGPAFQRVADYFLGSRAMEYVPIAEVSNAAGVSKATVSRFVQEMGYSGYKTFQTEMVRANLVNVNANNDGTELFGYGDVEIHDNAAEIGRKVFLSNIKALEDTLEMIDFSVLEQMAYMLGEGSNFIIFASGRSFVAADSIRKRVARLGLNCNAYNDPHEQALASVMVKPGDLVVGISAFGRSASVLHAMERCKKSGAMVVGLTSYRDTPIEKVSTHMLYTITSDPIFNSAEPSCTTVTHIALLDCLYMMLVMKNFRPVRELLKEGAEAMESERLRR